MRRLRIAEAAARAIVGQAEYYREAANGKLAERWKRAVDQALRSLLEFPERGAACRFVSTGLAGLRWLAVPGFPHHLIFYRYLPDQDVLRIVHVLHGARDLDAVFGALDERS